MTHPLKKRRSVSAITELLLQFDPASISRYQWRPIIVTIRRPTQKSRLRAWQWHPVTAQTALNLCYSWQFCNSPHREYRILVTLQYKVNVCLLLTL